MKTHLVRVVILQGSHWGEVDAKCTFCKGVLTIEISEDGNRTSKGVGKDQIKKIVSDVGVDPRRTFEIIYQNGQMISAYEWKMEDDVSEYKNVDVEDIRRKIFWERAR